MSLHVHFEPEADTEYQQAGVWYEGRREGLGLEFFGEVNATIRRILGFPRVGAAVPRVPPDLPVRRLAVRRFPYHVVYLETAQELRILAVAHDRRSSSPHTRPARSPSAAAHSRRT